MRIHRSLSFLLIIWSALRSHDVGADPIAIETYVGKRPAEADRVMGRFRALLKQHGYVADPAALRKLFAAHEAHPGLDDPSFSGEAMSKLVDKGVNAFADLRFDDAATTLGTIIKSAHANPIALATEPKYRAEMQRAMLFHALALGRLSAADQRAADRERNASKRQQLASKAAAEAADRDTAITELIHDFPAKVVTSKDAGQDAGSRFGRIRSDVGKQSRGKLAIEVSDPDVVIYVDEIVRGQGKVMIGDLVAERHRVLLHKAAVASRVYEIGVGANQTSRLDVDWDLDTTLVLGDWVGFEFPTERARAREADFVGKLARSASATFGIAVTVTRSNNVFAVTGTSYQIADGTKRGGTVELSRETDEQPLEQLIAYLDGRPSVGVVAVGTQTPSRVAILSPPPTTGAPLVNPNATVAPGASTPAKQPRRDSSVPPANEVSHEQRIAKADKLFEEARKLSDAGKTRDACATFDEALQLNRNAVGTILNVALCDETAGKVATASRLFAEARDRAREQSLLEHAKAADDHVTNLAPRVPHLTIVFAEDPTPDTKVVIDDEIFSTTASDVPVDPGTRAVTVSAPGRVPYETKIVIVERQHATLTIPKLARPITVTRTRRTVGKVLTLGGAGLFLGSVGIAAYGKSLWADQFANGNCSNKESPTPSCNAAGQVAASTARTYGDVATYVGVTGIAVLGVGAYLWIFAPSETDKLAIVPSVGTDHAALMAVGRF